MKGTNRCGKVPSNHRVHFVQGMIHATFARPALKQCVFWPGSGILGVITATLLAPKHGGRRHPDS
eukprot:279008-Amphidinium_carterae.1